MIFVPFKLPLRGLVRALLECVKPPCERAFEHELAARPELDDDSFYELHYSGSGIPKTIPIRLRALFVRQLGSQWRRLQPSDNPTDVHHDLDLHELLLEVQDEFDIQIPSSEMEQLNGSFDCIVRYLALKL